MAFLAPFSEISNLAESLKSTMDANELNPRSLQNPFESPHLTLVDVIPEFAIDYPPPPPRERRIWLPVLLFIITCLSTFGAGVISSPHFPENWWLAIVDFPSGCWLAMIDGLMYSGAVMTILLCH